MPLLLVFFASGASGLVYQIVWVRQFGNVFGSTVHSASLVTAVFMLGLGIGSFFGGRIADERISRSPDWPLRAYGWMEIGIGLLSAAVAVAFPALEPISAAISEYRAGADGWFRLSGTTELFRYGVAVVALAPITVLMGATLSVLIRHLVRTEVETADRHIAALYGVNTLGAAAGCLATDFVLVPAFGLLATQLAAVCLNIGAGAAAFFLSRRATPSVDAPHAPNPFERVVLFTSVAIAVSGFVSMGMQILWFRQLSAMLRSQRNVFSLLVAVILIGTALGTALVPRLVRRFGGARAFAGAITVYAVSTLAGLATLENHDLIEIDRLFRNHASLSPVGWKLQEFAAIMSPYLQVVLLPVVAIGTTYPLANACVQRALGEVGSRAGTLYLCNTLGAVAGALAAGFVLLPALGVQRSAAVLVALLPFSVMAIVPGGRRRYAHAGLVATAVIGYLALPADHLARRLIPDRFSGLRVVAIQEGASESLAVLESARGERRLITDGFSMSGTSERSQRYMRMFVHFPLLQMEAPENVLVVAFGVGNTAHAALQHPVRRIDVVDRSEDILGVSNLFSATNGNVLQDPRVRVFVNDGRQHLRMVEPGSYDLITSEPPPLTNAGVAALYSVEYYALARSRLKPGGWMTQWLPIYQVDESVALSLVRSFLEVFPAAILLSGWTNELILAGVAADRIEIDPDMLASQLGRRPLVAADLERIDLGSVGEIIAAVVGPTSTLHTATRGVPPVTDDWPIMEYESVLFAPVQRTPASLYAPLELREVCPLCFDGDRVARDLDLLEAYMLVHAGYLASSTYLEPHAPRSRHRPFVAPASPVIDEAVAESAYLRMLVGR